MAIYMTARFTVRSESVEMCQQAITELVDHVTRNEPETRMYISIQEVEDETRFLNFFIFENEDAEARHADSEALKQFNEAVRPECLEPIELTTYTLVASTEE
jgi:quinol monooxygenase YgiN